MQVGFLEYYGSAASWAFQSTWDFAWARLIWAFPVALASAGIGAVIQHQSTGKWRGAWLSGLCGAIGGPALVIMGCFLWNFVRYPPSHESELLTQAPELIPEKAILVPELDAVERKQIEERLSDLSVFINKNGREACNAAEQSESYGTDIHVRGRPASFERQMQDLSAMTRNIYGTLLGPHNDGGLLQSGDPTTVNIMEEAVQPRDQNTIIQFDGFALDALNAAHALAVVDGSDERAKLVDPLVGMLSIPMNQLARYTTDFCKLIEKTNARIAEIRSELK